jgi:hypothetical protein
MSLDALHVFGESVAGWCTVTPPNESADENGEPITLTEGVGAADPKSPPRRVYDDPDVRALREHLRRNNGLKNLEIVRPDEVERAARIFFRDGYVVVADLLDRDRLERIREGCARALGQILDVPGRNGRKYMAESMRLPHRYSFGTSSASRHMLHDPAWAGLIDLPTTRPILARIFGGDEDYFVWGAGGDVCLPGSIEYQLLHGDRKESYALPPERLRQARLLGILNPDHADTEIDDRTKQLIFERTGPVVTINFFTSDLTWENGPIRQISGTQARPSPPPRPGDEPEWMRLSTLVGARAGGAVIRDTRAWHGGTPNLSREIRAMPNIEYGAPWIEESRFARSMPHEVWETLSPHAQQLCARVKSAPGVWPRGAGFLHPLAGKREEAKAVTSQQAPD